MCWPSTWKSYWPGGFEAVLMSRRITVRLEEGLLAAAKERAALQRRTLTSLIEEGLRLALSNSRKAGRRKKVLLPVSRAGGGTMPGVDLSKSAELQDMLDANNQILNSVRVE
jgi:hypothetical protein